MGTASTGTHKNLPLLDTMVEVRPTQHGDGLFATADVAKGVRLLRYTGYLISTKESDALFDECLATGKPFYTMKLFGSWAVDGDAEWNVARKVNHSCVPNLAIEYSGHSFEYPLRSGGVRRVATSAWYVTTRKVRAGEELLVNYDIGFDPAYTAQLRCFCGSAKCVGYMVSKDDWPALRKWKASLTTQ